MNGLNNATIYCAILLAISLVMPIKNSSALAEAGITTDESGEIERLYYAAFGRVPASGGLEFWIDKFEAGQPIDSIARKFISSPEFVQKYGSLDDTEFARQLLLNVLGTEGAQSDVKAWTDRLASGTSRATVLQEFANSDKVRRKSRDIARANAELHVRSIRHMGNVRVNPMILMRDAGFSARFQGKSVWVFGDTVLENPNTDNRQMISNSLSTTFDFDAADGIDGLTEHVDAVGAATTFFPYTAQEIAFNRRNVGGACIEGPCTARWHIWPGTIVVDDDKGWAYVFYRKILIERGILNFHHVGHSLAVWKGLSNQPERPLFNHVESYPTLFWSEDEPAFDSAAVVLNNEVYVYGCELDASRLTKPCHLARVSLDNILDRSAWSFRNGKGDWSSNVTHSSEVFDGNDMMSVFFNAYINRFVAIYSEPLDATVMLRTAAHPEGPWSAPKELFTVEAPENVYGWVYDFLAHPELSQDDGRTIYITYSHSTDEKHTQLKLVAVEVEPNW